MTDIKEIIAKNIRTIQVERNISNHEIARRTKMMPCAINPIVKGKKNVSAESIVKIAEALNTTPDWLMVEHDAPEVGEMRCPHCGGVIYYGKAEEQSE